MITEEELLLLKKEAEAGKQSKIEAEATMKEVDKNIATLNKELVELGITDPDNAEPQLKKMEEEINNLHELILQKFTLAKNVKESNEQQKLF